MSIFDNTTKVCKALSATKCVSGTVLPIWTPITDISQADRVIRALTYFIVLGYFFLGVSIISDRFMAAIEMITSQERKYTIRKPNNVTEIVQVRIWNETVSNLTLMALGSSAPEILLSIIEICGKNFEAGELGPGTIVGSAAFNLFIIIGICVMIIPANEVRRTKHLLVFLVTSAWSVFAYIWLYLILAVISPGTVEVWEGILTFLFFPLTVISAYLADTKIFIRGFLKKKVLRNVSIKYENNDVKMNGFLSSTPDDFSFMDSVSFNSDCSVGVDKYVVEYMDIIKEFRHQHQGLDIHDLGKMAEAELFKRKPKSRAYYRMCASRSIQGSPSPLDHVLTSKNCLLEDTCDRCLKVDKQMLNFSPCHYTVMEDVGSVLLSVVREGPLINTTVVEVDFFTVDGTAKAGSDYNSSNGTLRFECGEIRREFYVDILDDEVYEDDEFFSVKLIRPRLVKSVVSLEKSLQVGLGDLYKATVMVFDNDYGGTFEFELSEVKVEENIEKLDIKILRLSGARGTAKLSYRYICETAIPGKHFECLNEEIKFSDNQAEETIRVLIFDEYDYDKEVTFYLELMSVTTDTLSGDVETSVQLGDRRKIRITISANADVKKMIDRLIAKGKLQNVVSKSTWYQQIHDSLVLGTEEDEKNGIMPSCSQYILHYLSFLWNLLFFFVPPTNILNGWLCFTVSIVVIGVLTAIIGDLASSFGCCIGLSDTVTAVTFVALGTSLPDTFASKLAAINDVTADSSIGNVMGSNAVNVFLGIGIAWSIASIYHANKGNSFRVNSSSLGFSVTLFCVFAVIAITIMLLRRIKRIGGELGGPTFYKYLTGTVFCLMWFLYILISSLETYCHIKW